MSDFMGSGRGFVTGVVTRIIPGSAGESEKVRLIIRYDEKRQENIKPQFIAVDFIGQFCNQVRQAQPGCKIAVEFKIGGQEAKNDNGQDDRGAWVSLTGMGAMIGGMVPMQQHQQPPQQQGWGGQQPPPQQQPQQPPQGWGNPQGWGQQPPPQGQPQGGPPQQQGWGQPQGAWPGYGQ